MGYLAKMSSCFDFSVLGGSRLFMQLKYFFILEFIETLFVTEHTF